MDTARCCLVKVAEKTGYLDIEGVERLKTALADLRKACENTGAYRTCERSVDRLEKIVNIHRGVTNTLCKEYGGRKMKHEKEWCTCDRCGAEIELPRKLFWSPKFPRIRRVKFDKPVKLSAQFYEIEKMLGTLETKLDPVDSFELREFYKKRTKDFDLCPECRKAFEEFMKNGR